MKKRSNSSLFYEKFWEHAGFPYPDISMITNPDNLFILRPYYVKLVSDTLALMGNTNERICLTDWLKTIHGEDMFPADEIIGTPSSSNTGSWAVAFEFYKARFGMERGTYIRSKNDLKKYKPWIPLTKQPLSWHRKSFNPYVWTSSWNDHAITLTMQDFPLNHLYIVESEKESLMELDDLPLPWTLDWPNDQDTRELLLDMY